MLSIFVRWGFFYVSFGIFIVALCGCTNNSGCVAGRQKSCPCSNGNTGVTVCNNNGSGWGICNCTNNQEDYCADSVDLIDCVECYCEEEIDICESNPHCLDLDQCIFDCADNECIGDCAYDYPLGVDDFLAILDCRDENCSDYQELDCTEDTVDLNSCWDCYCAEEDRICYDNDDCYYLYMCIADCDYDDDACYSECELAYPDGLDDLFVLFDCLDYNCAQYYK